jgi:hypothetical protein
MQALINEKDKRREYLLRQSMIQSVRDAAAEVYEAA